MEIEYISRDQLSDFYKHWMLVTYDDIVRYIYDGPVSPREALRDLFILGRPSHFEDYFDARMQAVIWSQGMKRLVMPDYSDELDDGDDVDPEEIEEDVEMYSSINVNVFFDYLTASLDFEIPSLPVKHIKLLGTLASRCFHSVVERNIYYASQLITKVPQTTTEKEARKVDEDAVAVIRDGGLFIEASALEVLKRLIPDWEVFLDSLPEVTKVVY